MIFWVEFTLHVIYWIVRLRLPRLEVQLVRDVVHSVPWRVRALQRIAICQAGGFHDRDAAAPLASESVLQVATLHQFVGEAALVEVEIKAVQWRQLRQEHVLELCFAHQTVPEHEAAAFAGVGVQIDVDLELASLMLLHYRFFDGENRRLLIRRGIDVVAIEVLTQGVRAEIAAVDTVGIEHWDYFEDELLP